MRRLIMQNINIVCHPAFKLGINDLDEVCEVRSTVTSEKLVFIDHKAES